MNAAAIQNKQPLTVNEALNSSEKNKWRQTMEEEVKSKHKNEVWELIEAPQDRQVIGSKWVFKRKIDSGGSVELYKACLVAQSFTQKPGLDYDETFCPVVRFESRHTLATMAVQDGLILHQMDVTSAFLNGTLSEEVYMKQPEGFIEKGKENLVCKLKHSIYGLKQSPRCWNIINQPVNN